MKIILSIKPCYVKKIFLGEKKFEYRKKIPHTIREVLVYSSSPDKRVVGKFHVKSILTDTPSAIWKSTNKMGGISKDDYGNYFRNKTIAYAIEISNVKKFYRSRKLHQYNIKVPPQSYAYVKNTKSHTL